MSGRVLIVDDDSAMCEMVARGLSKRGFRCSWRTSGESALAALAAEPFDVVITDLNMQGMSGLGLCERIALNRPDIPVVVITAFGSFDSAVGAIRAGAYDFITKPLELEALGLILERAVRHRALRQEVKLLRRALAESHRLDELVGNSQAMQRLRALIEPLLGSEASVLITGESGTGKEVVARALHRQGRRKAGPFVAVNCAALSESLLESELFGHARGAFTDAREARTGLLLQATHGTLFLDEIGEMSLAMQVKLLRALQERKVRPVGGTVEVPFDVRLVSATNRDLENAIAEGRFREDLYFRINVIQVPLPPLRARGGDILLLAQHFIEQLAPAAGKHVDGVSAATAERLMRYSWPGNVRELRNCIERAVAVTRFEQLAVDDLPERIRDHRAAHIIVAADDPSELLPMEEVERRYIEKVLAAVGGHKTLAAKTLGFDRKTLYNKLAKYHIDLESPGGKPGDR